MQSAKIVRRRKRAKTREHINLRRSTPKGKMKKVMAEETIAGEEYEQNSLGRRLLVEGIHSKSKRLSIPQVTRHPFTVVHTTEERRPSREERQARKQARAVAREEMFTRHRARG